MQRPRFTINAIPMHDVRAAVNEEQQMAERSDEGNSLGDEPQVDDMIEP